jgi:hypothetical protein
MSEAAPANELVQQLKRAGTRPPERLVGRILAHGAVAREPLLQLATDTQTLHAPEPACWGPIHALRLLGELPDMAMIAPLLDTLPIEIRDEQDQASEIWAGEVLDVIASCGPEAIPVLWNWADDETHSERSRASAVHTLSYIAGRFDETYNPIVEEARTRLEHARQQQDRNAVTFLVYMIAGLGVQTAYHEVMAAYREGQVDTTVLPASAARQLLLNQGAQDAFTRLSFWERYDEYGPSSDT